MSPIRSQSITALLSPKEMIREFSKRGSNDEFGIEGYYMPKSGSPKSIKVNGVIAKNKSPGPIEAEAKFRKAYPAADAYELPFDKPWTDRMSKQQKHSDFAQAKRKTEAAIIEENSKKPEKSTPSPNDYNVKKEKILPNLGRGGGSLLQA